MNEEQKKKRRAYKANKGRESYATYSEAKKQRMYAAARERYKSLSPEQKQHKLALERQAWARRKLKADLANSNAIDDLGTDTPDRSLSEQWSYTRDKKVRNAVLRRAKGKCEFCNKPGFIARTGKPYLETHHVIKLADEGADRLTNVIALCPNDHREAHYGTRSSEIEVEMIQKLKTINR